MITTAIALLLAGAAPDKPASMTNPALDCSKGYEALRAEIDKKPGLEEIDPAMPSTERYRSPTEQALYTVTVEGNRAHPAIVRQHAESVPGGGVTVGMLACGYSERKYLQKFMNTFPPRNAALRAALARGEHPFGVRAEGVPNPSK